MKKIGVIFGTRPEAIKLAPVIRELKKYFEVVVISTGQHRELLDQIIDDLAIEIDYDLHVMTKDQTLSSLTIKLHEELADLFDDEDFDLVVVQGDATTGMVGALEAFYHKIPVAHIEAGLRTNDIYAPFPEEVNRRIISQIAAYNFTPTDDASFNLEEATGQIIKTGNTGIDTLLEVAKKIKVKPKRIVLVTLHRRESFGEKMEGIMDAIWNFVEVNETIEVLFPVHKNPNVQKMAERILGGHRRIILCRPLDYIDMIRAMKECLFIMTDSGGIQEEAPSLNKPVLVLRDTTERMEGVTLGVSKLVGTNPEDIFNEAEALLIPENYEKMTGWINPYGDGKASQRIARYLKKCL